jgi:hypothetical protein
VDTINLSPICPDNTENKENPHLYYSLSADETLRQSRPTAAIQLTDTIVAK